MQLTDNQWKIFWWINDNYPEYVSESPSKHSLIINMIENYHKHKISELEMKESDRRDYKALKEIIKNRLLKTNLPGGSFTKRELAIIGIFLTSNDSVFGELMEVRTRESIDESGGCSSCGDISGFNCICEQELEEEHGFTSNDT